MRYFSTILSFIMMITLFTCTVSAEPDMKKLSKKEIEDILKKDKDALNKLHSQIEKAANSQIKNSSSDLKNPEFEKKKPEANIKYKELSLYSLSESDRALVSAAKSYRGYTVIKKEGMTIIIISAGEVPDSSYFMKIAKINLQDHSLNISASVNSSDPLTIKKKSLHVVSYPYIVIEVSETFTKLNIDINGSQIDSLEDKLT